MLSSIILSLGMLSFGACFGFVIAGLMASARANDVTE
jgi:hypothetical protein